MLTVVDATVAGVLAAWVGATVCRHLPPRMVPAAVARVVDQGACAWLVPSWNFFAPHPGTHTYHVLYRDEHANGTMGIWHEATRLPRRSPLRVLWNPGKTRSKGVLDVALELTREAAAAVDIEPALVRVSVPYLTLLSHVTALPHAAGARNTQFVVVQRSPQGDDVLFLSGMHPT